MKPDRKNEGGKILRSAFTLIELLVVVAIIAVLAAILFPVFARARENARRASCMSNMKQIGLGIMMYTQDYDERYPSQASAAPSPYAELLSSPVTYSTQNWITSIYPYVKSWQLFKCPSTTDFARTPPTAPGTSGTPSTNSNTGYMANGVVIKSGGRAMASIPNPAGIVMLGEITNSYSYALIRPCYSGSTSNFIYWNYAGVNEIHFDGGNLAFADGHVKWRKQATICAADYGLTATVASNACGPVSTTALATALF
jgi:prepilin-type N-terminal cleavage/methylation domain-containing protein/prepilin-type processing-associated H-X9-DG protein